MVWKVDTSSKIAMMSEDEVLVVVDKEPVAIQNSFFKNTTQSVAIHNISTPHKMHFKWQKATRYNLVFQNHAMKHALHLVN